VRLWLAQGLGIGRIPVAPGTFGSLLGVAWFLLLMVGFIPWLLLAGIVVGFLVSVWLCGYGERVLKKKDPGSVVLDEVTAMPVCFLFWVVLMLVKAGTWPGPAHFLSKWPAMVGTFAAFRLFDILKPWPVKQSQSLPGGWGITVDDFLAAGYVNVVAVLAWAIKPTLLL
jgi:phosphatidylglycerophosphatase A